MTAVSDQEINVAMWTALAPCPGTKEYDLLWMNSLRYSGSDDLEEFLIPEGWRDHYHYWHHLGEVHAIRQMLGHADLPQFVGEMSEALYHPEHNKRAVDVA